MPTNELLLLGIAGGLIPDILRMIGTRFDGMPAYVKAAWYWITLALLGLVGGLAAYLEKPTTVVEALAIGFSAPEILSRLLSKESADRGAGNTIETIRAWWHR